MKLKTYVIWDCKNKKPTWEDELPVTYRGIEIGKIINVNFSKLTGITEISMKIYDNNVKRIKKLLEK